MTANDGTIDYNDMIGFDECAKILQAYPGAVSFIRRTHTGPPGYVINGEDRFYRSEIYRWLDEVGLGGKKVNSA